MTLAIGSRLGSYEVTGRLGEGGMGIVYRAHDVKLGRDVALKVLPESVARDPDRLARFKREAHVLASLNHPHIGAIYGFEDTDGASALVLELVDGPTLADRIAAGPIPLDEALPIAKQIAEALEAAHEQGIIHRDLKPANIKVRSDGTVKVLDFGLAKALTTHAESASPDDLANSPTLTSPVGVTGVGVLLGTAAYMAPEQAKGRPADKRADLWAFGCVLYEMLTGRRAFQGDDAADTLAAVLRAEVDWRALPASVPPHVRSIVQGCLAKERAKRIPDISAIRFLMSAAEQALAPSESGAAGAAARGRWFAIAAAGLAVGVAITVGVGLPLARRPIRDPAPIRFVVPAPPNAPFGPSGSPGMSLSPDGRHLAFVTRQREGALELWIRSLDALDARALPGTRGATGVPFWSPDGRHIGFFADGKLKKIDVTSRLTSTLCDTPAMFGATWNELGDILFSDGVGILRVPSSGGTPTVVTTPDPSKEEREYRWPQFLPDGAQFLYLNLATTSSTIVASSLDSPIGKPLRESDSKALYASPGFLVFARQDLLFAQPFDAKRAAISGEAVPIAEGITAARGASPFTLSESGVLAFRSIGNGMAELSWFDRAGKALGRLAEAAPYLQVSLSPDGRQIAAQRAQGSSAEIWLIDVARGVSSRFRDGAGPLWSPDSVELAYYDPRSRLIQRTARDGMKVRPFASGLTGIVEDWSKDGRHLIYLGGAGVDIWALALDDLKPLRITQTAAAEDEPALSPNGRWLAYMSPESGRSEIYIRPFPPKPGDRAMLISTKGGHQPKWRGDNRELFFLTPEGSMMAVDIGGTPIAMEPGTPHALFQTGINVSAIVDQYAVTADGQKFLVVTPSGDATESPVTVVLNWAAGLKR